jgi:hypothetical protein
VGIQTALVKAETSLLQLKFGFSKFLTGSLMKQYRRTMPQHVMINIGKMFLNHVGLSIDFTMELAN